MASASLATAVMLAAGLSSCTAPTVALERDARRVAPHVQAAAADERGPAYALHCAKVLTMDAEDHIFTPGTILVRDGRIVYAGKRVATPDGYESIDLEDTWAYPGMVDLHTHIHTGQWGPSRDGYRGDINDMTLPINQDLSVAPSLVSSNHQIELATAGGVTTLNGIPGSGTSISGFGVLYKSRVDATYEETVLEDPGSMKVAQTHNPERWQDLGATRAGLSWMLEDVNDKARGALAQERFDAGLENLKRVHAKRIPVIVHCAAEGVASTARMWRGQYDTQSVLSHGSFDGWKQADYVARMGMPVNHGPRTTDFVASREGRIINTAEEYASSGGPDFSLNTDSSVIPQHELWLQGTVSARLGSEGYQMLRALTIHPARSFGIDDRVGSIEAGKDADIVLHSGNMLDPRERVELVLIDGEIQYSRERDGQWF